jgi:hypothetical protein
MAKYTSVATEIEAVQFTGHNQDEIEKFAGSKATLYGRIKLTISTPEGVMTANPGDWIIRGTEGEYYPCKPEVFAKKYRLSDGQEETTKTKTAG